MKRKKPVKNKPAKAEPVVELTVSRRYRLLTEEQVSEWFGIAVATLRTMRSRPGADPIPFTKIGGKVVYREDRLLTWLDRHTFGSTEEHFALRA